MLSEERRKQIEERVEALAEEHGLQTPGFDLARFLSTKEGFLVGEQDMEDDTTGILLVNKDQKMEELNTNQLIMTSTQLRHGPDYLARRRFIVAHEYAHYCLHMKDGTIYAHRDYGQKDTPMEEEADFFARCLLMPRKPVEAVLSAMPESGSADDKVDLIARTFGVTKKKARQRLIDDLKVVA